LDEGAQKILQEFEEGTRRVIVREPILPSQRTEGYDPGVDEDEDF